MIEQDVEASTTRTEAARDCLLEASLEFFAHREVGGEVTELRLHQNERIIRQLSESFAATAPWYARWGVRLNSRVRRVFGGASDFVRQLTPSAIAQKTAGEIKDKFKEGKYGGLITPPRLTTAIVRHGGDSALVHWPGSSEGESDSRYEEAAEAAINRFERDDFTSLDPRRLDEAVRQMWSQVPTHKKLTTGLTPLAAMFAAFAAVLMIPFDGGTAMLTIPELFGAAGFTTLATLWSGGRSTQNVGQQAARQQLADFHAVLCDTFGVARPESPRSVRVGGTRITLPDSQIVHRQPFGATLSVYRIREEFRQELQRLVPRSGPGES